jgi:hypothetical protein
VPISTTERSCAVTDSAQPWGPADARARAGVAGSLDGGDPMIPVVHGTGYGGREQEGALMAIDTPLATGPGLPPTDKPPRRWPWIVGLLVLGLVTAAITLVVTRPADEDISASTTNSTAPAAANDDAVIVKAYEDASDASSAVLEDLALGPDDPRLEATMAEPLLNYIRHQITDLHGKGIYYEPGGLTHTNFRVVERSEDRAVLRLCQIDKSYGYNALGERLAAPGLPGKNTSMEALLVRDAATGVWRVSSRYPNTGGTECEGI